MPCLTLVQAADALAIKESGSQPTQVQTPAYTPRGRQMERFKAFARQAELPAIAVTNSSLVEVGGTVKIDITRLDQLPAQEKEALAGQFRVPAGVIDKVLERAATNSPSNADQLAQQLRAAVIDYRFLRIEWDRYHPPAEGQNTRTAALAALQAGDINKAWELYDGLRKPQAPAIAAPAPPANLRIITQP
jgi:hypothetical protein